MRPMFHFVASATLLLMMVAAQAENFDFAGRTTESRIAALEALVVDLQRELAEVRNNSVLSLDGYLELETVDASRPTVRIAGANLQLVNGLGSTSKLNGLGNLILGYNEPYYCPKSWGYVFVYGVPTLKYGEYCVFQRIPSRVGSHNVVVGPYHQYTSYAGIVASLENTISAPGATVTGGTNNHAKGRGSSISGGQDNTASGKVSSISGGLYNEAKDGASSVSGGGQNIASGYGSSVSGGSGRSATGQWDWSAGEYKQGY